LENEVKWQGRWNLQASQEA